MTLNISVASPTLLCQVSDRRYLTIPDCKDIDDNRNKATVIVCNDARLLVSYHGIGSVNGLSTDMWISEQFLGVKSLEWTTNNVVEHIKERATDWFNEIERLGVSDRNRRHSFVFAGKPNEGFPFLILISNYESFEEFSESSSAHRKFDIFKKEASLTSYGILIGGSHAGIPEIEFDELKRLIKLKCLSKRNNGPRVEDIINFIVRIIRRTASVCPEVGPNCMSIFMAPGTNIKTQYHPNDSSSMNYLPNYINSYFQVNNTQLYTGGNIPPWHISDIRDSFPANEYVTNRKFNTAMRHVPSTYRTGDKIPPTLDPVIIKFLKALPSGLSQREIEEAL